MSDFKFREVFNHDTVAYISTQIHQVYPSFETNAFETEVMKSLDELSYKARADLITQKLETYLPEDKKKAISILVQSLGPEIEMEELKGYDGFYVQPLAKFVAKHGLDDFDQAMQALYSMTKRFSSEGPIRKFIRTDWNRVKTYLDKWVHDPNPHVRRLVSEGTRPRLPLSSPIQQFIDDPWEIAPYLLQLREDPVLYVRRSVANNINDISKDQPDVALQVLEEFDRDDLNQAWIIKHALRTLLKQTYPPALRMIGYSIPFSVDETVLALKQLKIQIGGEIEFDFSFQSRQDQHLLIHYVIHYMKANGKTRPKVFILRDTTYSEGKVEINRKHSFRQMTTRTHYPGQHLIEIRINGTTVDSQTFRVE